MRVLSCILMLFCATVFAQKEISHTFFIDQGVRVLYFNLNNVFQIKVHTVATHQVKISAQSEGEYANYFVLTEQKKGNMFVISGNITFTFPNFQDKLSAHKMHAISVEIWVPRNLQIVLHSDVANVKASGNYNSFYADLASGNCFLTNIQGRISASSVFGDIFLFANTGNLITETNLGVVSKVKLEKGKSTYLLKTNKGNITVKKI